jgi:hypothetical protein
LNLEESFLLLLLLLLSVLLVVVVVVEVEVLLSPDVCALKVIAAGTGRTLPAPVRVLRLTRFTAFAYAPIPVPTPVPMEDRELRPMLVLYPRGADTPAESAP